MKKNDLLRSCAVTEKAPYPHTRPLTAALAVMVQYPVALLRTALAVVFGLWRTTYTTSADFKILELAAAGREVNFRAPRPRRDRF